MSAFFVTVFFHNLFLLKNSVKRNVAQSGERWKQRAAVQLRTFLIRQGFPTFQKKEGEKMNSFISWVGGKRLLRKKIIEQFPEEYGRYIEVFGGAGWVLFGKEERGMEVYNDVNSSLVNLYRCVKYHPEALQKELDGIMMSREIFFDCIQDTRGLTDIQRAARFFVAIKASYATTLDSFAVRPKNLKAAADFLEIASNRLKKVVIENVDFAQLLRTYDRDDALFYLDPPYYNAENYYQGFKKEDHQRLKESVSQIKGKFLLSYNDCENIREMYKEYKIIEVERQDNITTKRGSRRYKELIIKNY